MKFAEWLLLEYKFVNDSSSYCARCSNHLTCKEIKENKKHHYRLGQYYECTCGESSLWTNSIRHPSSLLAICKGEPNPEYKHVRGYVRGFCNDLFCGQCYSHLIPIKNGYSFKGQAGDLYGCMSETCPNKKIVMFVRNNSPEREETTNELIRWYCSMRSKWEHFVTGSAG